MDSFLVYGRSVYGRTDVQSTDFSLRTFQSRTSVDGLFESTDSYGRSVYGLQSTDFSVL